MLGMWVSPFAPPLAAAVLAKLMRRGRRGGKQKFYDSVQFISRREGLAQKAGLCYSAGHEQGSPQGSN
jgi:hypothetical protein